MSHNFSAQTFPHGNARNNARNNRWLAFESGVLRRLQFASVAVPRCGRPEGQLQLKRRGALVLANDARRWAYTMSNAALDNTDETLSEAEIDALLADVYVPANRLRRDFLREAFGELDAWWFDNLRANIARLETPLKRNIALSLGIKTGEYALSFDEDTRELRQPLSHVFSRLWRTQTPPFDNRQRNTSSHQSARDFIAEAHADLLFLRLPRFAATQQHEMKPDWRDEWLKDLDEERDAPSLQTQSVPMSKTQFLLDIEDTFERALHFPNWVIAHAGDGFISVEEIVEVVARVRQVSTIYTKDFSEFSGTRAAIITAG